MGVATWAAFSGSDAHATVDGDFAMTAVELNTKLPSPEFPYDSAEALVDDIVAALEDEGYL